MKNLFLILLMLFSTLTFAAQKDSTSVKKFEETDKVLAKILDKSLDVAEKTGQFVIDQAPDVIQEFYMWNAFSNIFWIVVCTLLILAVRYIPLQFLEKEESSYYDSPYFNRWMYDSFWMYLFFASTVVIGGITILMCIYDLIFLLVSPKLYLIEYVMHLRQS